MSETVSQALFLTGGKEAFETAYFIGKIDKLFDCLNVMSICGGKKKRKVFQNPYRSATDFRVKVHCMLDLVYWLFGLLIFVLTVSQERYTGVFPKVETLSHEETRIY